jgi:hypothetical protein
MPTRTHAAMAIVAAVLVLSPSPSGQTTPVPFFTDVAIESGLTAVTVGNPPPWTYIIDNIGTGIAMLDYDLDGDMDIFQVQSSKLGGFPDESPTDHLYRNEGGRRFVDVSKSAGFTQSAWGFGVAAGDYDNDGDPDLFVTSWGPHRLYRNEGNGTFRDVAAEAGVDSRDWGTSAAFFDYDNDGLLDLYVAIYLDFDPKTVPTSVDANIPCTFQGVRTACGPRGLRPLPHILYHNNGDGTFSNANAETGMAVDTPYFGLGVVTGDIDNDGDSDIFIANDSNPHYLYRNDGRGRFVEEGLISGASYSADGREQAGMGCDMGDPDGDGDLDIYVNTFSHDYSPLYINDGTGFFEDKTLEAGLLEPSIRALSWGVSFVDLDNDGDEDLLSANGHTFPEMDPSRHGTSFLQACQVFLNDGTAHFTEVTDRAGPAMRKEAAYRGAAFGDYDDDGDIDVAVTRYFETPGLFRNDLPKGNHWTSVRLVGTRSNRDAVGARIYVTAGGKRHLLERKGGGSFESANDPRLHIGLGGASRVDSIEIRWPSGLVETKKGVPADTMVTFVEPSPAAGPPGRP